MNVKCKVCGEKGYWDSESITEYYAPKLKYVGDGFGKQSFHICRSCIIRILEDTIIREQHQIRALHYPKHSKAYVSLKKGDA